MMFGFDGVARMEVERIGPSSAFETLYEEPAEEDSLGMMNYDDNLPSELNPCLSRESPGPSLVDCRPVCSPPGPPSFFVPGNKTESLDEDLQLFWDPPTQYLSTQHDLFNYNFRSLLLCDPIHPDSFQPSFNYLFGEVAEPTPVPVPQEESVSRKVTQRASRKTTPSKAHPALPSSAISIKENVRNSRITGVRRANVKKSKRNSLDSEASPNQCNSDAQARKKEKHKLEERVQRQKLKDGLQKLRILVPETEHNSGASTKKILTKGREHCCELRAEQIALIKQKEEEKKRKEAYIKKLLALKNFYSL